jgi:hypothetical protein
MTYRAMVRALFLALMLGVFAGLALRLVRALP